VPTSSYLFAQTQLVGTAHDRLYLRG